MNLPTIEHIVRDEENNLTFRVMAYRRMSDDEVATAVAHFHKRFKGPKIQNQTVTINTFFGDDPD